MEGNLRFKIDWASLIAGRKFAVFALFYYVFFPGGLYFEGRFNGGFLRYEFAGLIFRGAYVPNSTVYYIQNEGSAIAPC